MALVVSAGRFLTPEITAGYPRLELMRCVILCLSSKRVEAAACFEAVARETEGFTQDRNGGDAEALVIDRAFARAALLGGADRTLPGDLEPWLSAGTSGDKGGPTLACARHTLLCTAFYERASFEACSRHGLQALAHSTEDTRFGDAFVNICLGMAAMAQGRTEEAGRRYRRARHLARRFFSSDAWLTASTEVLTIELALEHNREKSIRQRTLRNLTELRGVWVDVYSTAVAVNAELMLGQYDSQAVIRFLSRTVDDARATGIEGLANHMSALLADHLVEAGRSDEAGEVWRDGALPCGVTDLLDIERQSWRTMETLSCARVRLLAARGACGAAEALVSNLCTVASEHGLTRTLLRGLALSMVVADRAGQPGRALDHLRDFLNTGRGVGYIRPLVRHRLVSQALLKELLATDLDDELRSAAESARSALGGSAAGDAPFFSGSPKTGVGGIGADSAGPRGAATAKGQLRTDPRIPLPGRACGGLLRMSGAGSGGTAGVSTRYARPPLGSGPSDDTPAVPPLREQLWALRPGLDGGVPAVDDFTPGARGVVGAWA